MNAQSNPPVQPQTFVQRALGGHAAIGLLASALLYIISLSGALVVIHDRWQRWEQPNIAETATMTPVAAQAALAAGLTVDVGKPKTEHLYLRFPTEDLPRPVVTTDHGGHYTDANGRIVAREAHAWTEFLIELHEYLHLPMTLGLIAVGALGVAMVALTISGVLAHPRILRDAFVLRARHDGQIARADWHNRLGVWTLPFALALALTGAFIGLGSVGFSVLAKAYTGGDIERAYAPIFGAEPAHDAAPAPLADIAAALTNLSRDQPGVTPTYAIIHDPATRGQFVQIIAEHPRRLIYGETYRFAPDGTPRGKVGLSDGPLGQQFAASTYNLHFGNFGGLAVELIYMALGLALCVVIATGTTLWLQKRERRGLASPRLRASWAFVVWGTPTLLVLALWQRALLGPDTPLAWSFWIACAVGLVAASVRPRWFTPHTLKAALALAVAMTAVIYLLILRPTDLPNVLLTVLPGLFALGVLVKAFDRRRPAA